ncbi:MAG: type II toxin-antitoxin system VapC family toxin [Candidatus Micrarchaeota archaeon]
MRYLVDTCIFMYAAGSESDHKASCAAILRRIHAGEIEAAITTETFQEITYRFSRMGKTKDGADMCWRILAMGLAVLPVTELDIANYLELIKKYGYSVSNRDLLQVCVAQGNEIQNVITVDLDFRGYSEVSAVLPGKV